MQLLYSIYYTYNTTIKIITANRLINSSSKVTVSVSMSTG